MIHPDAILHFWFPPGLDADRDTHRRQLEWWFRGGADAEILERFPETVEIAARGDLDAWVTTPRGRLALVIVLDQFSRTVYRDTARAFAQDEKALGLALEGIETGVYRDIGPAWERLFFALPLSHSERLEHHERAVELARAMVEDVPAYLRDLYEFSANQARGHRDVVARFGRHPHRNAILGRASTPEELAHLATGQLVHTRPPPR